MDGSKMTRLSLGGNLIGKICWLALKLVVMIEDTSLPRVVHGSQKLGLQLGRHAFNKEGFIGCYEP